MNMPNTRTSVRSALAAATPARALAMRLSSRPLERTAIAPKHDEADGQPDDEEAQVAVPVHPAEVDADDQAGQREHGRRRAATLKSGLILRLERLDGLARVDGVGRHATTQPRWGDLP